MSETQNILAQADALAKQIHSEYCRVHDVPEMNPAKYHAMVTQMAASLLIGKTEGQVRMMWREILGIEEDGSTRHSPAKIMFRSIEKLTLQYAQLDADGLVDSDQFNGLDDTIHALAEDAGIDYLKVFKAAQKQEADENNDAYRKGEMR